LAAFGRPPIYCSVECRREMTRRRRDLANLEANVVDARQQAKDGYYPSQRRYWRHMAAFFDRQAAELRLRIPEEMQ
jgi:hypothetical protein